MFPSESGLMSLWPELDQDNLVPYAHHNMAPPWLLRAPPHVGSLRGGEHPSHSREAGGCTCCTLPSCARHTSPSIVMFAEGKAGRQSKLTPFEIPEATLIFGGCCVRLYSQRQILQLWLHSSHVFKLVFATLRATNIHIYFGETRF